jgi:uncharacterized delta-60 repeat protein
MRQTHDRNARGHLPKHLLQLALHAQRSAKLAATFIIAGLLSVGLAPPAFAQGGSLDTTFGGDGKVTTDFTSGVDFPFGTAIESADGRIVAVGRADGGGGRFALARYDTDGTLDATFGGDGKVTTNFSPGLDSAVGVVIQPADGKIVAAGYAPGSGGRFALARYDTDGTLDATFGGDGKVTTNFTSGSDGAVDVAIQSADGKIVASGVADGGGGRFALARYESDGTLDATFGGDGRVTTDFTSHYEYVDALDIQPADGKIVAAGSANYFGSAPKFALARYNTDGSLDATFSGDGKVTTSFAGDSTWAFAVAIQPADGRIVAAGHAGGGSAGMFALARYDTDGTLDPSFGRDGKAVTNFTSGLDYTEDIAIQSTDGKIVAAGTANYLGPDSTFALARYDTDGTLDTAFSGNGKLTTDFTGGLDGAFSVAIQPADGGIVAVGRASGSGGRFALARYLAS